MQVVTIILFLHSLESNTKLKVGGNYVSKEAIDTALDALQTFDPGTSKITMIDVTVSTQ